MKKCQKCKHKNTEPVPHCALSGRDLNEHPKDGDCVNFKKK